MEDYPFAALRDFFSIFTASLHIRGLLKHADI